MAQSYDSAAGRAGITVPMLNRASWQSRPRNTYIHARKVYSSRARGAEKCNPYKKKKKKKKKKKIEGRALAYRSVYTYERGGRKRRRSLYTCARGAKLGLALINATYFSAREAFGKCRARCCSHVSSRNPAPRAFFSIYESV